MFSYFKKIILNRRSCKVKLFVTIFLIKDFNFVTLCSFLRKDMSFNNISILAYNPRLLNLLNFLFFWILGVIVFGSCILINSMSKMFGFTTFSCSLVIMFDCFISFKTDFTSLLLVFVCSVFLWFEIFLLWLLKQVHNDF